MQALSSTKKQVIRLTVINNGTEHEVQTHIHEYRNLMVLLNNIIYLEDFGECGGQGRCATCLVEITGMKGSANNSERNEQATLAKTGMYNPLMRLSCQVLIDEALDGCEVKLLSCVS